MSGGRDPFDPFSGFGAFGGSRSLMSSFFGGRDPFDDPFFTRPFGGMFESNVFGNGGSPFMGALPGNPFMGALPGNPFMGAHPRNQLMGAHPGNQFMGAHPGNQFMGTHPGNQFMGAHPSSFIDDQPSRPSVHRRGPIIEEVNSDDEKDERESQNGVGESSRKHGRSSQGPFVEDPDDEVQGRRSKLMHLPSDLNRQNVMSSQPRGQSYTFHSSTVSYGGTNGTYYTTSNMRRTGTDGLTFEESKEANSATGQAKHRVSRGINDKGHSVMRKLNTDRKVDTMQTLHNLEKDELSTFEIAWEGAARDHLPGVRDYNSIMGAGSRGGPLALPSTGNSPRSSGLHMRDVGGASPLQNQGKSRRGAANGAGPSRPRPREGGTSGRN